MSIDLKGTILDRRSFLIKSATLAAAAAGGFLSCENLFNRTHGLPPGCIEGSNRGIGHLLLSREHHVPSITEKTGVVIAGGGIAGLSAARELTKNHCDDFILLELEDRIGGNSASGENKVSPYSWGAHYVPLPGEEAVLVRELFEELGIIETYDGKGLPVYNEYYLCADPQERLFIHGRWQEGLVPHTGISGEDSRQYESFFRAMRGFREARGSDGKHAFSIPVDNSSRDSRFLKYDSISMAEYLTGNGWDSEYLRWYVNYCCRDDYGTPMHDVSAWAGIHYFAARTGEASNADSHAVVTWPEGNSWIVKRMTEGFRGNIRCNAAVLNIEHAGDTVAVDYYDVKRRVTIRLIAKAVIYAAPRFTAIRTLRDFREKRPSHAGSFSYAPWMIANLTLKGLPEHRGAPLAWDNVSFYSDSLGYINANHQDLSSRKDRMVLTYYFPLTSGTPEAERRRAVTLKYEEWAELIVRDLASIHPDIQDLIEEIKVWLWGHAMVRPITGFIWGKERREAMKPQGKIFFAHSDMSGISIFEEAQYRGIMASREVMTLLNGTDRKTTNSSSAS